MCQNENARPQLKTEFDRLSSFSLHSTNQGEEDWREEEARQERFLRVYVFAVAFRRVSAEGRGGYKNFENKFWCLEINIGQIFMIW